MKQTQAQVAEHLFLSLRNLRDYYARGRIDKAASLDEQRRQYISHLRETAANRVPNGPLDPQQEKARLDKLRADQIETKLAAERKELMPAHVFESAMADAFKAVAGGLENLPGELERDGTIGADAVDQVERVIDRIRDDLVRRLQSATTST